MRKRRCNFAHGLAAPKPKRKKYASDGRSTRPTTAQIATANNCATPWRDAGTHPLLGEPAAVVPPHKCRRRAWSAVTRSGERVRCEWRS